MSRLLLIQRLAVLGVVMSVTFSFAGGPALEPTIDDASFQYYESSVAYLTANAANGTVTVQIQAEPTSNALALRFDEIEALSAARNRELYGWITIFEASDQAEAREDEQSRLRKLAGMDTLKSGWRVVHESTDLNAAIDAYTTWFASSGLDMVPDQAHSTGNVKAFTAAGQGTPLRVVFHREGNGVRVYLGPI